MIGTQFLIRKSDYLSAIFLVSNTNFLLLSTYKLRVIPSVKTIP